MTATPTPGPTPFPPPRKNVVIAADGGGIKGLIAAKALIALEQQLGVGCLIDYPGLRVLAGSSTGTLISAGLAIGMTGQEIFDLYHENGRKIFPPLVPGWFPASLAKFYKDYLRLFRKYLYSNQGLKDLLRKIIKDKGYDPDITLSELNTHLEPRHLSLIITVMDINCRRTRFLKSYDQNDKDWKLWEAILTSAAAPTFFPIVVRQVPNSDGKSKQLCYFMDGSVGGYSNPAYIATREAVEWGGCAPEDLTVFSLGTGWLDAKHFEEAFGPANKWGAVNWIQNIPAIMINDSTRSQSLDLIYEFMDHEGATQRNLDFRRFQVSIKKNVTLDDTSPEALKILEDAGKQLAEQVTKNQHELCGDPKYDPEGLWETVQSYQRSIQTRQNAIAGVKAPVADGASQLL